MLTLWEGQLRPGGWSDGYFKFNLPLWDLTSKEHLALLPEGPKVYRSRLGAYASLN